MKVFRLIRTPEASAAWNMAVDEALLRGVLEKALPVFRLYRWSSPAFTFGVSQNIKEGINFESCLKDGIALVRRITGGGILYHFDEVTYSLVCSKEDAEGNFGLPVSYRYFCSFLMRFYESFGLKPSFAFTNNNFAEKSLHSDICCASHEKYDILVDSRKIGGNAQKRTKEVILQHGSIPINIDWSNHKKYLTGFCQDLVNDVTTLKDELNFTPEKNEIENKLIQAFKEAFKVDLIEQALSEEEKALVDKLVLEKYNNPNWNEKRKSLSQQACLA